MYGPKIDDWKWIGLIFIMGFALIIAIWLLGPPALITGLAWLAVPRLGYDHVNYLQFYGGCLAVWTAANVALVALATWPMWAFWENLKQRKRLRSKNDE